MVFESIVTDLLNRILGDYVENLDSKQLKIGIWGGDVVLKNLLLKPTALDDLDLPVQTVYGQLDKLVLKIPWKNLYGAAVEAYIDGLYILVVPNQQAKYSPEKEILKLEQSKQKEIQKYEEAKKKEAEKGKPKPDDSFVEKLATQIIKNVQLQISNIHIRYEDKVTNPKHPFAMGITLKNLSLETTDENWKPVILEEMVTKIYKVVSLEGLAAYWNCSSPSYANLPVVDLLDHLKREIATRDEQPESYSYLLGPINSSARLRLNPKPECDVPEFSIPKVHLNLEMEKLSIAITKSQYKDLLALTDSMDLMAKGMPYRQFRPDVDSYKNHYKEWWHFAYKCVLSDIKRRRRDWDWNHIMEHRNMIRDYSNLFKEKMSVKKVSSTVLNQIGHLEKKLDIFNIIIIRQKVAMEIAHLERSQSLVENKSWFSSWWGSAKDADKDLSESTDILKQFETAMTPEEKSRLYQAIDYQENSAPLTYPEAYVDQTCTFILRILEIQVLDNMCSVPVVLDSKLKGVKCRLDTRPAGSAIKIAVNVDEFDVYGLRQDDLIPHIVTSKTDEGALLDVLFEINPLDKTCSQRLHVDARPVKIIYDAMTINKIVDVFQAPQSSALDQLSAAAGESFNNFKEMSATGLQYAIESHSVLDLKIDLCAPYVVVAYGGKYTGVENVLVFNLGRVQILSVPRTENVKIAKMHAEGTAGDKILEEMIQQSYDVFTLEFTDLQIVLAPGGEEWEKYINESTITQSHLLNPLSLNLTFYKCLISDDPRLPLTKIRAELPSISFNITDVRLLLLVALATSIPFPQEREPDTRPLLKSSRSMGSSMATLKHLDLLERQKVKKLEKDENQDSGRDLIQFTTLDAQFVMKEFSTMMSHQEMSSSPSVELLQFKVNLLECAIVQQTYNTDITFRLGGINLKQNGSNNFINIIDNPIETKDYLFVVKFLQVARKSPEFHSKYKSCESQLSLEFSSLNVILHQEGLQEILQFATDLQSQVDDILDTSNQLREGLNVRARQFNRLASIAETISLTSRKDTKSAKQKEQKQGVFVETIQFKLLANMDELTVKLTSKAQDICSCAVKGLTADVIIKKSYTQIKVNLLDMTVIDLNPKSIYSTILCVTGDEAVKAQVVMYSEEHKANDPNSVDMSVEATMGCLRIVFLNWFITNMLNFLNHFQEAQEKIREASQAAAETAKQNMQNALQNAVRISLKISLKAPDIIVPSSSQSKSALLLDLGNITISNRFLKLDIVNDLEQNAVIDEMSLKLTDFSLARVEMFGEHGMQNICGLLQPVTFTLTVKRNLSSLWYRGIPDIDLFGKFDVILLHLSQFDYEMIMSILSGNLAEGHPTSSAPPKPTVHPMEHPKQSVDTNISVSQQTTTHTAVKFNFTMESFVITLFTSNFKEQLRSPEYIANNALARFSLEVLSVKGSMMSNSTIATSVVLVNCLMDDMRKGNVTKLNRLMERKIDNVAYNIISPDKSSVKSMIDLVFKATENDTFVDVRVSGFIITLSMEFLMKLSEFFTVSTSPKPSQAPVTGKPSVSGKSSAKSIKSPPQTEPTMTINLRIEQPDIILVENMNDINTNAIILNTEVILKFRTAGLHQVISGSINDTQFYTCTYNPAKRAETKSAVLHPVSISIAGSTPEDEGLHIEVYITDVRLSISPATIELLNRVYLTLVDSNISNQNEIVELKDYSRLWDYKPYEESDFWFLQAEAAEDAVNVESLVAFEEKKKLRELCIVALPSLIVTIEAGVGKKTLPMLLLESSFRGTINDWSSQMTVDASLTLQLGYYNSRLAIWEPLIEPTEIQNDFKSTYVPWELKLEVSCNEPEDDLTPSSPTSESEETIQIQQAAITIDISSKANLELTVTKTSLEVLNNLSQAFTTAMSSKQIVASSAVLSPYTLKNYSGFRVTLSLNKGPFQVYDQSTSAEIVLESDAEVPLQLVESCQSLTKLNSERETSSGSQKNIERILYIEFKDSVKCSLQLPVVRADTRYFMLNHRGDNNDNWGLVSAITVDDGVVNITLRSILQVQNHFNIPVEVYYMTVRDNELECISTIKPGGTLNIPINAVYTPTSELFFSIAGYSVTSTPFVWKDLQLNLSVTKQMQCVPKNSTNVEPFIMKVVGETEQVYFENTTRHTMASTCYNIHLHPAVSLKNFLPVDIICCVQNIPTETLVKPGEKLQMPTVNPGVTKIVIRLPSYLEKEWSCQHEVLSNNPEFAVWQFDSHDGAVKVSLDLGMHTQTVGGSMIMSLYCPFWMLNKTGLLISYRKSKKTEKESFGSPTKNSDDNLNVLHHPPTFKGPVLFSFNAKNFFGKKKASVRIEQGEWSDKFSIDVAGSSGFVICKYNGVMQQVGVHNQLTYNGLTKQITFTPFYVIINNAPFAIECQELDRPAEKWLEVEKNSCSALWPHSEVEDKLLKIRVSNTKEISTPFLYTEMHTTVLKLLNKYGGINVDIQITEGGVYINLFAYDDGMAPALVINHTNDTLSLWEKETVQIRKLQPNNQFLYTWENPSGPRVLLWDIGHKKEVEDDLRKDGIGEFCPQNDYHIYWVSFLDGMQRILLFTLDKSIADNVQSAKQFEAIQQEINISIHGVGLSLVNNIRRQDIMYVCMASSGIIWETCKLQSKRYKQLNLHDSVIIENSYQTYLNKQKVDHVDFGRMIIDHKTEVDFQAGLMLKPNKRKLRRTFQTGLWLQMKTSPSQLQLHAKINRLQIDNQMLDCVFPVVLAPVPPPKSVALDNVQKPFAELSIVQRIIKYSQISQYKYFKLLIQEFHIKVDLGFVNAVCDLLESSEYSEQQEQKTFLEDVKLVDQPLLAHVSTQSLQEQKNFYDLLHFSPLKVHISFSMASGSSLQGTDTPNFLNVLLQGLGVTLTDMQDVVFRLAYFQREYSFLTKRQLISEATTHYVGQSIKQLYVLVLGLDVLGNPYGLVLGITKGVEDLFYEPFQGAIQGPGEFAEGLVLGVRSLFGHTVGGAAGAVSRITGAMGKGIAVLTFDEDYQRKRRDQINKKPATVQEGLARGSKGLVMGVVDGVTGVFTKPISGAKEQGVEGFFKGLGKGAVGLVTRPTAGVIDFASGSFDAVKRAAELGEEVNRLRPPRFLQSDGYVKPYNHKECTGYKILMDVEKGKYANTDVYSSHFVIIPKKEILMLTDKRLAYVTHNDIFGGWQIDWSYTWQEIQNPPKVVPKGVAIVAADAKKKKLGFFGSSDAGKIILVGDPVLKNLILSHIEELLKNIST